MANGFRPFLAVEPCLVLILPLSHQAALGILPNNCAWPASCAGLIWKPVERGCCSSYPFVLLGDPANLTFFTLAAARLRSLVASGDPLSSLCSAQMLRCVRRSCFSKQWVSQCVCPLHVLASSCQFGLLQLACSKLLIRFRVCCPHETPVTRRRPPAVVRLAAARLLALPEWLFATRHLPAWQPWPQQPLGGQTHPPHTSSGDVKLRVRICKISMVWQVEGA